MGSHYKAEPTERVYTIPGHQKNSTTSIYVALGDSLTAGVGANRLQETFPYIVAAQLASKTGGAVEVHNLGAPGATAKNVVDGQLAPAVALQPQYVTLLIGINDIHNFVSVNTYQANMDAILAKLQTTGARVVVASIPNIGVPYLVSTPYSQYFAYKIKQYNSVLEALCQKYSCAYANITGATAQFTKAMYAEDLFHPSGEGYALWSDIISNQL